MVIRCRFPGRYYAGLGRPSHLLVDRRHSLRRHNPPPRHEAMKSNSGTNPTHEECLENLCRQRKRHGENKKDCHAHFITRLCLLLTKQLTFRTKLKDINAQDRCFQIDYSHEELHVHKALYCCLYCCNY